MTDLFKKHPVLGPVILFVLLWAMGVVTALVVLLFIQPDLSGGAASVAVSIVGIPGAVFGVLQWMKRGDG